MAIIDRVKWDGGPSQLAWKYPSQELSTMTQLIVNESQVAFVVRDGVYEGPFGAGRHTLSTGNIPLLRKLVGLPFGGQSPFSAEVWFVNLATTLDVRWGTPDPIQLQDPKFGIMVPVRAFGQYAIEVADPKLFLMKLVGTARSMDAATLAEYFRAMSTTRIKSAIAGAISASGVSVLEISSRLDALSATIGKALAGEVAQYGVALTQFSIESINVPETDSAVQKLKAALARRAEMNIIGFDYQEQRRFDVLQAAARNEGSAGTVLGAGMGVALGSTLGASVGKMAGSIVPDAPAQRMALLRDLAALREQNILTDAEFDAEKKRILA
ncbi:SPFH domain-containing protein [Massilia frigida]|nr:SPFH domain-containing protein [Massilia frigida]